MVEEIVLTSLCTMKREKEKPTISETENCMWVVGRGSEWEKTGGYYGIWESRRTRTAEPFRAYNPSHTLSRFKNKNIFKKVILENQL